MKRKKTFILKLIKSDLIYSDATQGEAQGSPPRKRAKIIDAECVIPIVCV